MKLGTIIQLPDGRIGTICWHNLDGYGGVWGRVDFSKSLARRLEDYGFDDEIPPPVFMLRDKDVETLVQDNNPHEHVECVGADFEVE